MANRPLSYKGSITHSRGGWPTAFGLFRRAVSPSAAQGDDAQQIRGTDLVGAVRTLAAGESMLDPEAASRVMKPPGSSTTRKSSPLVSRLSRGAAGGWPGSAGHWTPRGVD